MKLVFRDGKWVVVGKVQIGEQSVDVDTEVSADQGVELYTADQRKELFFPKKDFARRTASLKATTRAELLQDEEFRTEALQAWNVTPADANSQQVELTERLATERARWEQQNLSPIKTQLEQANGRIQNLLRSNLHADILSAAAQHGLKDEFLKPVGPKKIPLIINMLDPFFAHDDQTDKWLVAEGDGFAFASSPTADRTYKDVHEFVGEWVAENPSFAKEAPTQTGPNARTPNGPQSQPDLKSQIATAEASGDFATANALKAQMLQQVKP